MRGFGVGPPGYFKRVLRRLDNHVNEVEERLAGSSREMNPQALTAHCYPELRGQALCTLEVLPLANAPHWACLSH